MPLALHALNLRSRQREVSEVRIPTGAGGVGFLPLLVMEKYQSDREVREPGARFAGSTSVVPP